MKNKMSRVLMALVMAAGLLGNITACSAAKPSVPIHQVKMSEEYIFAALDGEWVSSDECGKIVFDCGDDEKKITMKEITDNGEWVVTGECVISKLNYSEGDDPVVKFTIVSAGDEGIDNEFTLDTEKETLRFKQTSSYSREYTKIN